MYGGSGTRDIITSKQQWARPAGEDWMLRLTHQMAALFCVKWPHGRHLESVLSYQKSDSVSQCVFYVKNNPAKFYPDPIWNDRALRFFGSGCPNKKSSGMNDAFKQHIHYCLFTHYLTLKESYSGNDIHLYNVKMHASKNNATRYFTYHWLFLICDICVTCCCASSGLLHVTKLPQLNALASADINTADLAFKVRRKRFTIEVFACYYFTGDILW